MSTDYATTYLIVNILKTDFCQFLRCSPFFLFASPLGKEYRREKKRPETCNLLK